MDVLGLATWILDNTLNIVCDFDGAKRRMFVVDLLPKVVREHWRY